MSNNRKIYAVGLLILIVMTVLALKGTFTSKVKHTEVSHRPTICQEDACVIQFDIINHEGTPCSYAMEWYSDGEIFDSQEALIGDKQTLTNTYNIYPHTVNKGKVYLLIRNKSENVPFRAFVYSLPSYNGTP